MSNPSYDELQYEIAALKAQAAALLSAEKATAAKEVRDAVVKYGLTAAQCGFIKATSKKSSSIVAGAYKNPQTGEVVHIRIGKRPKWLTELSPDQLEQARV